MATAGSFVSSADAAYPEELQIEAYRNVVAAALSHQLHMPQLQDVLGESGGEHIKANCCNTYTALEDTVLAVQGRKKSKLPSFFEDQSRPIAQKPPVFFRDLLLTIEKNSNADGLFRVSGNETRVKALKAKIDARQYVNFDRLLEIPPSDGGCKVEDLISLMKTYLRSFKDPVIPSYQNDAYLQAAELQDDAQRLEVVQLLLLLCPPENRHLMQMLFKCLSVVLTTEGNRMDSGNLCKCIAPSIINVATLDATIVNLQFGIVRFMISNSTKIFEVPAHVPEQVSDYLRRDLETSLSEPTEHPVIAKNKIADTEINHELWVQWEKFRLQGEATGGKDGKRMVKKALDMQKKLYSHQFQDAPATPKSTRKNPLKLLNYFMTPGKSAKKRNYRQNHMRKQGSFDSTPATPVVAAFSRQASSGMTASPAPGSNRRTSDLDKIPRMRTLDEEKENSPLPRDDIKKVLTFSEDTTLPPRYREVRQTFV